MLVKSENKHHQMTFAKFGSGVAISSESMNRQKFVIRYIYMHCAYWEA